MIKVSVVIPNYNGKRFLEDCLGSLAGQSFTNFEVILVDNGSSDGSCDFVRERYPEVRLLCLEKNYGFCGAVNAGIRLSEAPFVILLNNDVRVTRDFVREMVSGMRRHPNCFSGSAQLRKMYEPEKIDDAGDYYCALGWAFARGKDKGLEGYQRPAKIFASCGGAAIYRRKYLEKTGLLDERHFAYLEDIDLGYRARICGYENRYFPKAVVYHAGSGTTGSRYNVFKVCHSARNNVYMLYKNMPLPQLLLNLPLLLAGFAVKLVYFAQKGFGGTYAKSLAEGIGMCKKERKFAFRRENLGNYMRIQLELWRNLFVRLW